MPFESNQINGGLIVGAGALGLLGSALGISMMKPAWAHIIGVITIAVGAGVFTGLIPDFGFPIANKKSNYATGCSCGGGY